MRRILPYIVSAVAVAVVAAFASILIRTVSLPHVSVLFMAAVLTSAAIWGFWPAIFASVLSVATSMYFFYSPVFDFRVAAAQDIADLGVFVIVASLTSRLAANVRAQVLEARRQQKSVSALLAFSQRISSSVSEADLNAAIAEQLATELGRPLHLLVVRNGELEKVASLGTTDDVSESALAVARDAAQGGGAAAAPGWRIERLATAQGVAGMVLVSPRGLAAGDPEYEKALLGQAALAMERARMQREIGDARVRVQGDALREALINSISHDLRTPLAAILGSATALESVGERADDRTRQELTATIREEAERLEGYIDNVLDLTRIRAGQIAPRLELVEIADIVNAALRRKHRALAAHTVELSLPPDLPMLRLDLFLMEHAIANVIDNAAKFSPAGSTIRIRAAVRDGAVRLEILDEGPGIRGKEQARVFDAFYRGDTSGGSAASGTGLGLAICRAFVEANGGEVAATGAGSGPGTCVLLCLPLPQDAPVESQGREDG